VKHPLGSSGKFYVSIQNGAPFDLCFSVDIAYAHELMEAGFTAAVSLYEYYLTDKSSLPKFSASKTQNKSRKK